MGCLSSFRLWRKKGKRDNVVFASSEKGSPFSHASAVDDWDLEKPRGRSTRHAPSTPTGWDRPDVNPSFSAYSTPGSPTWTARAKGHTQYSDTPLRKEESIGGEVDEEEARRRKAEQEEQERLDFFQMM